MAELSNILKRKMTYEYQVSTKINKRTYDILHSAARLNNTTVSEIVRTAIEYLLDNVV